MDSTTSPGDARPAALLPSVSAAVVLCHLSREVADATLQSATSGSAHLDATIINRSACVLRSPASSLTSGRRSRAALTGLFAP